MSPVSQWPGSATIGPRSTGSPGPLTPPATSALQVRSAPEQVEREVERRGVHEQAVCLEYRGWRKCECVSLMSLPSWPYLLPPITATPPSHLGHTLMTATFPLHGHTSSSLPSWPHLPSIMATPPSHHGRTFCSSHPSLQLMTVKL